MARPMTTTSYALLGLLGVQKWSTYELAKQVERSLGWFWPRTERKIYDQAKRLVEDGLASASSTRVGARPRTLYGITPKGRRALRAWLSEPSAPPKLQSEAQVKVFFADAGDLDQLQSTLKQIGEEARDKIDELHRLITAAEEPDYEYANRTHLNAITIRYQLDYHEMTAHWADWALRQTRRWITVDDPGNWNWKRQIKRDG